MRWGIMGAGSIGCWVGGRLAASGASVRFVGRRALGDQLATTGLHLTRYDGARWDVATLDWSEAPGTLADCEAVLVCVKGLASAEVGATLASILAPHAVVLSLQNGVSNAATLAEHLSVPVFSCMVPFNVVRMDGGRFHRGTSGHLTTEATVPHAVIEGLRASGLEVETHADIQGVLWGKLLINLNNAVNALADVPLKQQLEDPLWRRVMADVIAEGLAAVRAAGIQPVAFLPVPPWVVPHVLRLPTFLFTRVARSMVAVDPEARSSMWEDLKRGRKTEVDLLNGEIVRLGRAHGVETPVNERVVAAIRAAETGETAPATPEGLRRGTS